MLLVSLGWAFLVGPLQAKGVAGPLLAHLSVIPSASSALCSLLVFSFVLAPFLAEAHSYAHLCRGLGGLGAMTRTPAASTEV